MLIKASHKEAKPYKEAKLKKNITIIIMKHSPKANATVKYYVKLPVFEYQSVYIFILA